MNLASLFRLSGMVLFILLSCLSCTGGGGGGEGRPDEPGTPLQDGADEPTRNPAGSAIIAWDASTSPDVRGYKVYCGTASGDYGYVDDVGSKTSCTLLDLTQNTQYYCAVTAYVSAGTESWFSNEVSFIIPAAGP